MFSKPMITSICWHWWDLRDGSSPVPNWSTCCYAELDVKCNQQLAIGRQL